MKKSHICVCICTYKRPKLLERLLKKLQNQKTEGLFTYSIIIVDNDHKLSAENIVLQFKKKSLIAIDYYVEPRKNIALVRNKAVQNANGDFLAFIDDDEFPTNNWLLNLYKTYSKYKPSGVLGPVKPHFELNPPQWIKKSKIFERPSHKTGFVLHWTDTRTGNVFLRKDIFNESNIMFNQNFGRDSEDKDLFRRMIEKGYVFIWCDEASVYETILPERFKRSFHLKRALLRGKVSLMHPSFKPLNILKSIIAFSVYTLALPFLFLIGHHIFMRYLIKDFHHMGKLMGACGFEVVK